MAGKDVVAVSFRDHHDGQVLSRSPSMKRPISRRSPESVVKRSSRGEDGVDNDPAGLLLFSVLGKVILDPVIGEVEVSS